MCVPKCSSFNSNLSPTNNDRSFTQDFLAAVCVVGILGGMVFIVLALIRRDEMYVSHLGLHHARLYIRMLNLLLT